VESLLATPFPSPEEVRDYLGEWRGEHWIDPAGRSSWTVTLRAEGGRVVGEIIDTPEPGVEMKRPLQYLKLDGPGRLAFGVMNGMRPRGVLIYDGRRVGDLLEGTMRWGGVSFTMEDGSPPPTIHFSLKRSG
jgi:hypothetical protein